MQVGDLVIQLGWEADGVGIVTRTCNAGTLQERAHIQWPSGVVVMHVTQLKVISESR